MAQTRCKGRPSAILRRDDLQPQPVPGNSGTVNGVTRILVVDDEPQILRALRINLRVREYEVVTAATGAEALQQASRHPRPGHPGPRPAGPGRRRGNPW